MITSKLKLIGKYEKLFFLTVTLVNTLPILLFKFFPTMDGAAHLYNATLINELILGANSNIALFYEMNSFPIPNWVGHFVLSLLLQVFPAYMAEKVLLLAILIFLPWTFRQLILQYTKPYLSYIIFPACYSLLFYMGFYNLTISLIMLFLGLWFFSKIQFKFNIKNSLLLFLIVSLAYFSHIMGFATLLMCMFIMSLQQFLKELVSPGKEKYFLFAFLKRQIGLVLAILPTVILFLAFMSKTAFFGPEEKLTGGELIRWIKDIRPLIALDYEAELRFTEILYHLIIVLITVVLFVDIESKMKNLKITDIPGYLFKRTTAKPNAFLITSFILLMLFFIIPNSSSAGMMSDRLSLMFFIFLFIWIAVNKYPNWLSAFAILIILYVNFGLVKKYVGYTKGLSADAVCVYEAREHIAPYSTVLPINNSGHWLQIHFSNYLGADKPLVILENVEACVGWFPVRWNFAEMPNITFGSKKNEEVSFFWKTNNHHNEMPADYVFIWGYDNKLNQNEVDELDKYYTLTYSSANNYAQLYQLKTK